MNEITVTEQYKKAAKLNQRIIFTAQMAQKNLYDMCCMLKEMRDGKLYKELGYTSFEDYCENEIGITRRQGQKYSKIGEMYSTENGKSTSHFKNIGTEKLYLLASLSESQQEEIQQNVNVEDISVRKLKEEIAKLKEDNESAEQRAENERQRRMSAETDLLSVKSKNRSLTHDLDTAQKKITELESRPATVVEDMQAKAENEQLRAELEQAKQTIEDMERSDMSYELKNAKATIRELDKQLSIETQDHANEQNRIRRKYQDEINRLNEQLKKQEENVRTVEIPDMKEVFRAYYQNAINAFNAMINFISGIEGDKDFYLKKSGQLVGKLYDTLEEIKQ